MSVWFPLRVRGVYESVEYMDDECLEPKEHVKHTEEECDELCNKLNTQIQDEVLKAARIIGDLSMKLNLGTSYIIPILKSQLYDLGYKD